MLLQGMMQPAAPNDPRAKLLQALARRGGAKPGDARFRSLAALPPYGEQKSAETFGGQGTGAHEAFQDGAYQGDGGYQIF